MLKILMMLLVIVATRVAAVELPPPPKPLSEAEVQRLRADPSTQHLKLYGEAISCIDANRLNATHAATGVNINCHYAKGGCVEGSCRIGVWVNGWE